MLISGEVRFILAGRKAMQNNNYELTIKVKDFKKSYLSTQNVNNEYTRNFYAWHKLLEILEEEYKKNILRINYKFYNVDNGFIIFTIDERSYYLIDDRKNELSFIYEKERANRPKIIEVGGFESLYIDNNEFYLKINITNNGLKSQLPKSGIICEDYRKNLTLINRELKAINAFNNEDYISSSNLKSIFSGISPASHFNIPHVIKFFNEDLDATQKNAVKKSLNSQDISLIQGPPGTGKTYVIIEIIRQIFEINKVGGIFKQKVLLVSQAHPAVDKMLEDLDELSNDKSKVLRVGKDENLTEIVKQKYAVDYAQARWVKNIIVKSNAFADNLLDNLKIDKDEFNNYYNAKIELDTLKEKENIAFKKNEKIINKFEEKYRIHIDSKDFSSLLIQKEWVNRIVGRIDIQQHFIKNAVIVAGTCTGFVSNYTISDMNFDYVIIDEAAKATFPELLISIIRAKKIIMVGDHKQLPPILEEETIRNSKSKFDESNLDYKTIYNSIFMKLYEHVPAENKQLLSTQYRMHPAIGTMISHIFYDNQLTNGISLKDRTHTISIYKDLAVVWIDTSKCKDRFDERVITSYRNFLEANIVKEQLKIVNESVKGCNYDVGIITPYNGQKNLIKKEITPLNCNNTNGKVIVNSVDAFQGGQKDIIIYSTVRSSEKRKNIDFIKSKERLNVSFSRAKRLLIIIGDSQFLNDPSIEDNTFPKVIKYIKENPMHCKIIDYSEITNKRYGGE